MNPILKNVLAVLAGIVVGGLINMGLIILSASIIPLPEGINPMDPESLKAGIHLFEAKHFIFPFLAHALGALAGAFTAAKLAANNAMKLAVLVGAFFLIGGVMNAYNIPAPSWFIALDLIVAYLPMGWLGGRLAAR